MKAPRSPSRKKKKRSPARSRVPKDAPAPQPPDPAWPDEDLLEKSRVVIAVRRMVMDARILDEVLGQVRRLSFEEFRVLNSLSMREFEDVVHGAIFDAGEKVKFWERYRECETWGRREMRAMSAKVRTRVYEMLLRDLSSQDYRSLNQLPDSAFWRVLKQLFEDLAEDGLLRLPGDAVGRAIREGTRD